MCNVLSVLLYVFGIILLIVLIVLGIRLFYMLEKMDRVLDDIEKKVKTLDNFVMAIEKTTDGINSITNKVSMSVLNLVSSIFSRRKNKSKNKEEKSYE